MSVGGETVSALLSAYEYFPDLVNEKKCHNDHRKRLQYGIDIFNKRYNK